MSRNLYYKGMRVNAFGLPILKSKSNRRMVPTEQRKRKLYNVSFMADFTKNSPKDLIIIYDIPEANKKERDWFRRHLVKFDYEMIQRSVWVGPSPLPQEFVDYVKEIGLTKKVKTFKLAKSYSDKEKVFC